MRFSTCLFPLLLCWPVPSLAQQPGSPPREASGPLRETVIDQSWVPQIGSAAEVVTENLPSGRYYADLRNYLRSEEARDSVGTRQLLDTKAIVPLPKGTKVLVLRIFGGESPLAGQSFSSTVSFNQAVQSAVLAPPAPAEDAPALEVRIAEGPYKDESRWVVRKGIGRTTVRAVVAPPEPKKVAPPRVIPASERAESLLLMGQALEKAGNTKAALGYYREILEKYPGEPAAKGAAERAKALDVQASP
jgi:Tetratricopeptide repeat